MNNLSQLYDPVGMDKSYEDTMDEFYDHVNVGDPVCVKIDANVTEVLFEVEALCVVLCPTLGTKVEQLCVGS